MANRAFSLSERQSMAYRPTGITNSQIPSRITKKKNLSSITVSNLLAFLELSGYPEPISNRTLQGPSCKIVLNIFEHMIRKIDPLFTLSPIKTVAEESFLNVLRILGYQGVINKSTVSTPGAPHAWPIILAALDWLRTTIINKDAFLSSNNIYVFNEAQLTSEVPIAKLTEHFLFNCIDNNISTISEISPNLIEEFKESIYKSFGCSQSELDRLSNRVQELESEPTSENLISRELELNLSIKNLTEKKNAANDEYEQLIFQLNEAESSAQAAADTLSALRTTRDELQRSVTNLKSVVATQKEKLGGMVQKYNVLVERHMQRSKVKNDLKADLEVKSIELAQLDGTIAPAIDKVNDLAAKLLCIPSAHQIPLTTLDWAFDPFKKIPIICDELRTAKQKTQSTLTALKESQSEQKEALARKTEEIEKMTSECEQLKIRLDELNETGKETENEASLEESSHSQWLSETSEAIRNARQSVQIKKEENNQLLKSIKEYQSSYEYYRNLNKDSQEYKEKVLRETRMFINAFEPVVKAKICESKSRQDCFEALDRNTTNSFDELEKRIQSVVLQAQDDDHCLSV